MRIGICTFHKAYNYGAIIQTYCLQQYLIGLGHEAFVVDYNPEYFNKYKPTFRNIVKSSSIVGSLIKFLSYPVIYHKINRRNSIIGSFWNNYRLYTLKCNDDFSSFDVLVLGSDQIWNPKITGEKYDDVFWGRNANCRVISYAASTKQQHLSLDEENYVKAAFARMHSISVRELSVKSLFQPFSNKKISVVLDPTLLVDRTIIESIAKKSKRRKEYGPYVLVYEVSFNKEVSDFADRMAKMRGLDIVRITASPLTPTYKGERLIRDASVPDFLAFINNADCIVTTSFHGTALAISLRKNFYTIRTHRVEDNRMDSLLGLLNLLDHFVENEYTPECWHSQVLQLDESLFAEVQSKSRAYLDESLS